MNGITFYLSGDTAALRFAGKCLYDRGLDIAATPSPEVTHLLLPVPSFEADGRIKGGGSLVHILNQLPENVTILGGNLQQSALENKKTLDFLQDAQYLSENAAITADCAIRIAGNNLPIVFRGCPILVIGWGRIGKCLAANLKAMGADVTVAARKEADRAALISLGYRAKHPEGLHFGLVQYRVIFNTVPAPILSEAQTAQCRSDCIMIDLASQQGIFGNDVIWARGLPARDTPESSGALIARTAVRLISGKEASI